MISVVCVGDVMVDVHAQLSGELALGSDTPSPVELRGGGSAANTAVWLAAAGVATTFVGRVGADPLGRHAIDELAGAGVHLAVFVDPQLPTGICIVLVAPDGERTMVPSPGANTIGGEVPRLAAGCHLHVSGYALFHPVSGAAAAAALREARELGCPVSIDAASAAPLRALGTPAFFAAVVPALLFANAAEAAVLAGTTDVEAAARSLGRRCGEAIVKCGADGAIWSDGADLVRERPAPAIALDSTGAGDAFAAGVLAARLSGASVAASLRAGNDLAGQAIARRGARPVPPTARG